MSEKITNNTPPPEVKRLLRKHKIRLAEVLSWKVYPSEVVVVKKSGHKIRLRMTNDSD